MYLEDQVKDCRKSIGAPGRRKFSFLNKWLYLNVAKPEWCDRNDNLWDLFQNKWRIFEEGNVVWAHIVQANTLLFESGKSNCPASVVFCPDPEADVPLGALADAAECMFELKHTTPDDPQLRSIAEALTDEMTRTFGVAVPKQFSNGYQFFESSIFITRKHLPTRMLSQSFFPILVTGQQPYYCLPLPSKFWPEELVNLWRGKFKDPGSTGKTFR